MKTFNYKMLVLARELRGFSQKELSEKVDALNQGNLSKIERGLLNASESVIDQSAQALSVPIQFFFQVELKSTLNEIYYRKRKTTLKRDIRLFEARRDLIVKTIDTLMKGVEMSDFSVPQLDINDGFTPVIAARKLREYFKIPKGPVRNIVNKLEREGIFVQFIEAPSKIAGCTMISDNGVSVIFVNRDHPVDKQRFTIAHELGHIVMHLFSYVPKTRDVDAEADQFAAEFLMPERDCLVDLTRLTFSKLSTLKAYWGVSYATIIRRAYDLGKISKEKMKSLYIQRSQAGYIKSEPPCGLTIDQPKLLKHICKFYLDSLEYSIDELLEALRIFRRDFEELLLSKPSSHRMRSIYSQHKPSIDLRNLG